MITGQLDTHMQKMKLDDYLTTDKQNKTQLDYRTKCKC